ncbi:MAG: DUF1206 domain-containing protein [Mycobacteriales bacterium]
MTAAQAAYRTTHGPWPERLTRLGLACRGVLYIVLGILAIGIALGNGDQRANQKGALQEVAAQPFGQVLIWVVALGLAAYALWRLATAAFGMRADPAATKASARVKALLECIGYGTVAALAVRIAATGGSSSQPGGGDQGPRSFTETVLEWPAGQWLVGLVGALIVGAGAYLVVEGWRADFTKELALGRVGPTLRRTAIQLGRVGRIARGIAFALIGLLIVDAAVTYDPSKAKGLDGTLRTVAAQPFGTWLLVLIALGLIAFGAYGLLESRLRRLG